ncbi:hypothetical protein FACS189487_02070 [Campylobacterota bacterium]|nr:hypothetical protein FACS189487_02070 [Campylobacterota bacterium]
MSDFYHTEYTQNEIKKLLLVGSNKETAQINPQNRAAAINAEHLKDELSAYEEAKLAFAEACTKTYMFEGMVLEDILKITNSARVLKFAQRKTIFSEGDTSTECYFVLSGFVDVFANTKSSDRQSVQIGRVSAGNVFGEMASLLDAPRSATCVAAENTTLLKFAINEYESGEGLSKIFLQFYINMSVSLAHKLKKANSDLAKSYLLALSNKAAPQ